MSSRGFKIWLYWTFSWGVADKFGICFVLIMVGPVLSGVIGHQVWGSAYATPLWWFAVTLAPVFASIVWLIRGRLW